MTATVPVTAEGIRLESAVGLLPREEVAAVLRAALGERVSEPQIGDAIDALQAAEMARWEQLPPELHPDMGYNYRFLACSETCWLGRQILIEGATFRVFKLRAPGGEA